MSDRRPDPRAVAGVGAVLGVAVGVVGALVGFNIDHSWFGLLAGVFLPLGLLGGLLVVIVLAFGVRAAREERQSTQRKPPPPN